MIRIMDSHAYPGCLAVVDEQAQEGPIHVEFGDGTVAGGRVERADESGIVLTIDAYTTRKGTRIAKKSWLLENRQGDRWRVSRRLDRAR